MILRFRAFGFNFFNLHPYAPGLTIEASRVAGGNNNKAGERAAEKAAVAAEGGGGKKRQRVPATCAACRVVEEEVVGEAGALFTIFYVACTVMRSLPKLSRSCERLFFFLNKIKLILARGRRDLASQGSFKWRRYGVCNECAAAPVLVGAVRARPWRERALLFNT